MFQHRRNCRHGRAAVRSCDNRALGIERIGFFAECDGEFIDLARIEHPPGKLGRLAQRDRQHTFGQRIERAAMTNLGPGITALAQHPLDRTDRLGRAEPARLVEDQPAMRDHWSATALASPRYLSSVQLIGGPIVFSSTPNCGANQVIAINPKNSSIP